MIIRPFSNASVLILTLLFITTGAFIFFQIAHNTGPGVLTADLLANAVGGVGIGATVPPNQYNTIAEGLTNKEKEIAVRERFLREQELSLAARQEEIESNTFFYLLATGGLLLVLILVNFYLDYRRRKEEPTLFHFRYR